MLNNQIQGYKVVTTCQRDTSDVRSLTTHNARRHPFIFHFQALQKHIAKSESVKGRRRSSCTTDWPLTSVLTSGHHDVGHLHRGLDVLLKRGLHKLVVLLDDAADVTAAVGNVPLQPPYESDVWVCVHEHLHVQELRGATGRRGVKIRQTEIYSPDKWLLKKKTKTASTSHWFSFTAGSLANLRLLALMISKI